MEFNYFLPVNIVFGSGKVLETGELTKPYGKKALIDIVNIQVIKGALPNKQLRLILAWCTIHQDELMQNWELAKDMKPLNRINPLI